LEQKTAIAHEAKSVLDSWVRYEGQVKQRQQRELAESVIAKIEKELENPKTLKQILDQSVADVERKSMCVPFCHKYTDFIIGIVSQKA
jgi:F-type H+-transporting ATPase subunit b